MRSKLAFAPFPRFLGLCLPSVVAAFLALTPACALPAKGTPAPPLDALKLLQAPANTKTSWASLKGKVVVLEFWATWCSPCVASFPHLNQLAASLDPNKFQFISIDDEDQKTVERFLRVKKIAGWVGIDTAGRTLKAYSVTTRPTTVIVDANGKIAAVTTIDSVTEADLIAISKRKAVALQPAGEVEKAAASTSPELARSLFGVTVSQAQPGEKPATIEHVPTGIDFLVSPPDGLLSGVLNIWDDRYALRAKLPEENFNLRVNLGNLPDKVTRPIVQQALLAALHLQIQPRTITAHALLLRAVDSSKLSPSASSHAVKRTAWHGRYILMNGTMDDLAFILGAGLETPVINQTGIPGTFDARIVDGGDTLESVNAALRQHCGLELVPGGPETTITVQEIIPLPAPAKP